MDDNKAFIAYALILVAGVASVISASVMAGFATLPTPLVFAEHLAMSLLFRAAYKSIGGYDWVFWADGPSVIREAAEDVAQPGVTADAMS